MRSVRVLETVLVVQRVVVTAGAREGRSGARSDGVQVDPVQPGRKALDLDVDVHDPASVLRQVDRPDLRAGCVDERPTGMARAFQSGGDRGREQQRKGCSGDQGDASAGERRGRRGRHGCGLPVSVNAISSLVIAHREIYAERRPLSSATAHWAAGTIRR